MVDGLRMIRVISTDESLLASARAATSGLEGWELANYDSVDDLLAAPPVAGDVILIDKWLRGGNVFEACRSLTGHTRCRTFIMVEQGNTLAGPIARFCGGTGVLTRPLAASQLREAIEASGGPRPALPAERRSSPDPRSLPQELLTDLEGEPDPGLIAALIDKETGLFNFAFLNFKLDEEVKRALRSSQPLACVMLGFEGQADDVVLGRLAGIFLETSRDTDTLGRFDESSFLFLLPGTGPDGAGVMARRVVEAAAEQGLTDLVGDPLTLAVGIATCPHPDIKRKEDLFQQTREAFFATRQAGGGLVTAV
jgi:GGDEF domain-containing protein